MGLEQGKLKRPLGPGFGPRKERSQDPAHDHERRHTPDNLQANPRLSLEFNRHADRNRAPGFSPPGGATQVWNIVHDKHGNRNARRHSHLIMPAHEPRTLESNAVQKVVALPLPHKRRGSRPPSPRKLGVVLAKAGDKQPTQIPKRRLSLILPTKDATGPKRRASAKLVSPICGPSVWHFRPDPAERECRYDSLLKFTPQHLAGSKLHQEYDTEIVMQQASRVNLKHPVIPPLRLDLIRPPEELPLPDNEFKNADAVSVPMPMPKSKSKFKPMPMPMSTLAQQLGRPHGRASKAAVLSPKSRLRSQPARFERVANPPL